MNIPAATKIDSRTERRAKAACRGTKLRMADLLRIGLDRVVTEFETTRGITQGDTTIRITSAKPVTPKRKGGRGK